VAGPFACGHWQGRPNLLNMGLFIWRLKPYRIEKATAFSYGMGSSSALARWVMISSFSTIRPNGMILRMWPKSMNWPVTLRIEPLAEELAARRRASAEKLEPAKYFFGDQPPFEIYLPNSTDPSSPRSSSFVICLTGLGIPPCLKIKRVIGPSKRRLTLCLGELLS